MTRRIATLITGLKKTQVEIFNPDFIYTHEFEPAALIHTENDDIIAPLDRTVQKVAHPIHEFARLEYGDVKYYYIAYSKDIQEFMKMPFDMVKEAHDRMESENYELKDKIDKLNNLGFLGGIKFWWNLKW